jgi:SAM-dependent methyltransferase
MSDSDWNLYQRACTWAGFSVAEVARRIPVPRHARTLLDIGGGHGRFAIALCERQPQVCATILDLPDAVRHAAPLVAGYDLSDCITHRVGDALTDDLGEDMYDIVIINNLVHHFEEEANRALTRRVAQALRLGGVMAIGGVIPSSSTRQPNRRADCSLLRADEQSGHVVLRRDDGLAAWRWTGSPQRRAAADCAPWWTSNRPQAITARGGGCA